MPNIYRCSVTECCEFNLIADCEDDAFDWIQTHTIADVKMNTKKYTMDYDEEILYKIAGMTDNKKEVLDSAIDITSDKEGEGDGGEGI